MCLCMRMCWLRVCLCGRRTLIRLRMSLQSRLLTFFQTPPAVSLPSAGVYHFVHESGEDKSRIHLRIDGDGSGLLIINVNQIFHLNATAATMAYFHLKHLPVETSIKALKKAFDVSDADALLDYQSAGKMIDLAQISYVCTAGGAMVRFLSGKKLPLVAAMEDALSNK